MSKHCTTGCRRPCVVSIRLDSGAGALLVNGMLVCELRPGENGIRPEAMANQLAAALGVKHQAFEFDADPATTDWCSIHAAARALHADARLLHDIGFVFKPAAKSDRTWRVVEPSGRWPNPQLDEPSSLTRAQQAAFGGAAAFARDFHDISEKFWNSLGQGARHELIREAYSLSQPA